MNNTITDIKYKQKEVLDSTRKLWKDTCAYVVDTKTPEWIKTHWRDIFQSITSKSREMTKIYKRKKLDDDVKLINLLDLKVKIVNEINERIKKEPQDITTFGEFFDKCYGRNNLYATHIYEFKVDECYAEEIKRLIQVYSDININNSEEFYTEKQLDKVYFYINRKNNQLEATIINYLTALNIEGAIEWL